jgi:type VI secretion system protein ImpM
MAETGQAVVPGWYGKLPGAGDFVSRRLPEEFVRPWDAWLQEVVATTRASLGTGWTDRYLTMPIWRFVLVSGLVAQTGWAGVLMPSVDRVGRQFPLTIAVALPSEAALVQAVFESAEWYGDLEDAALGVLDPSRGPDELERALANCAFPLPPSQEIDLVKQPVRRLPSADSFGCMAKVESLHAWVEHAGWKGVWWTRGRVDGNPLMMTCAALPTTEEFGRLLT